MNDTGVYWHEGDSTEYFTRTIYLYIDGFLKGFVAESGELGWLVFRFSIREPLPHLSLEDAQAILEGICIEQSRDGN